MKHLTQIGHIPIIPVVSGLGIGDGTGESGGLA
jgi:hypothetical protein